jgi:hypothetical protein
MKEGKENENDGTQTGKMIESQTHQNEMKRGRQMQISFNQLPLRWIEEQSTLRT